MNRTGTKRNEGGENENKDGRQVRKQSGETWPERPSGLVRPASSLDDNAAGK